MTRALRAVVAVVVGLGLAGATVPATGLPDVSPMVIGSTGCCKT